MKIKHFLLLLLILPSYIYSQEFEGGIVLGVNATAVFGDQLSGPDKPGLHAGAYAALAISENSTLQMELSFVQKGSKHFPDSATQPNYADSYLLRLNYAELPVIFQFHANEQLTFETGASYAVLINSPGYERVDMYEQTPDPPFNAGDLSIHLGGNYLLTSKVRFSVRASHSILPIRSHNQGGTYLLNRGQYNQVLAFTLRYRL